MIKYGLLGLSAFALVACGGGDKSGIEVSGGYAADAGFYGGNEYPGQPAQKSVVVQEAQTYLENGKERVADTLSSRKLFRRKYSGQLIFTCRAGMVGRVC